MATPQYVLDEIKSAEAEHERLTSERRVIQTDLKVLFDEIHETETKAKAIRQHSIEQTLVYYKHCEAKLSRNIHVAKLKQRIKNSQEKKDGMARQIAALERELASSEERLRAHQLTITKLEKENKELEILIARGTSNNAGDAYIFIEQLDDGSSVASDGSAAPFA